MINRLLATGVLFAMLVPVVAKLAPIDPAQVVLALFGWGLAYFGDEVAPLIGIDASSSSVRFIDPVIRTIGWLLLLSGSGLLWARVIRLW
jgi:hypothetical protein